MRPKMNAPTARVARVSVMAKVIDLTLTPKVFATSSKVKIRMKKSNASSVQLKKAAATALRAREREMTFASDMFTPRILAELLPDKPSNPIWE